jgi:hypothetical protein
MLLPQMGPSFLCRLWTIRPTSKGPLASRRSVMVGQGRQAQASNSASRASGRMLHASSAVAPRCSAQRPAQRTCFVESLKAHLCGATQDRRRPHAKPEPHGRAMPRPMGSSSAAPKARRDRAVMIPRRAPARACRSLHPQHIWQPKPPIRLRKAYRPLTISISGHDRACMLLYLESLQLSRDFHQ